MKENKELIDRLWAVQSEVEKIMNQMRRVEREYRSVELDDLYFHLLIEINVALDDAGDRINAARRNMRLAGMLSEQGGQNEKTT